MKKQFRRAVQDDCQIIFEWANDELVRENSFNSNKISYAEHVLWFQNKLVSDKSFMFIFCVDDKPAGQVRIDIENEVGIISYSLDKTYRGKGLALEMLQLLEGEIGAQYIKIKVLVGYVKANNLASIKIFEKLEYLKLIENENYKYYKYI